MCHDSVSRSLEIHSLSQFATSVPSRAFKTLTGSQHTARTQCATISLHDTNITLKTIHVLRKTVSSFLPRETVDSL